MINRGSKFLLMVIIVAAAMGISEVWAAIAVVQHKSNSGDTSPSTLAVTFNSTTGAGNLIVCAMGTGVPTFSTVSGVADDLGHNFIQFPGAAVAGGNGDYDVWYLPNSTAGSQVMTVTYNGSPHSVAGRRFIRYTKGT